MLIVLVAAVATWLNVVRTIRDPDPLAIPERPPIAGIVWSNRVFVHEKALKRWLETRGSSYAAWARAHPRAVAVLRDRPPPRRLAAASRKPQQASAAAPVASDEIGLAALALLVAGVLGATALSVIAAKRAVVVALERSSGVRRIGAPRLGHRSRAAWERLARACARFIGALLSVIALLLVAARRVATAVVARSSGLPSVHRRPRASDAALSVAQSREPRAPDAPPRVRASWIEVAPGDRVIEPFGDAPAADSMRRLYDTFLDALDALSDYRFRIALWVLTIVIAGAGLTFLISQSTQP